jgi:threonine/homoserine/homoserine lactone efflux protein
MHLFSYELLAPFFFASLLLSLSPGPDNLFVLTQSALHGRAAGLMVTLGLCTGLVFHTTAVALGVAAIFKASAVAFTVLKLSGAAYLLYLALQAFRSTASTVKKDKDGQLSRFKLYRRGVVMNITNPKVSIFFLAFLPQFADTAKGSLAIQMVVLGNVFIFATILVFGSIALMAGLIGEWLSSSPKAQIVMNRIAGIVFASLAIKLILTER